MRKMTLEFEPYEEIKEKMIPMFEDIYSYEMLEELKTNWEEGTCVDLIECILKEGSSIQDIKSIGKMEILNVLKTEGSKNTCLVKHRETEDSMELFREFDLDLIFTTPNFVSQNKITCSYIGDNKNLTKFVELIKSHVGRIENLTFKQAAYQRQDILSVLTDKQRKILITAHKHGYYDYPRKINSEKLSKKVSISKPTLVQHLRKAEGRILTEILEGYSA